MLRKKYRLPVQGFPRQSKAVFRGKHLTVKTAPNNLLYNRFGVVLGRGQAKLATERNFLRRATLDFFGSRKLAEKTKGGKGKDFLVIINTPQKEKIKKEDIVADLEKNDIPF